MTHPRHKNPTLWHDKAFRESIREQIEKGNHTEYFEEVLRYYAHYKKIFRSIFEPITEQSQLQRWVYTFDVQYMGIGGGGDTVQAYRKFEITGDRSFAELAAAIILSMGWVNDHMHGFELTGQKPLASPSKDMLYVGSSLQMYAPYWEDDPHPTYKTSDVCIGDILYDKQPEFLFTFDYGDGHTFRIYQSKLEMMRREDDWHDFPRLLESHGIAPEQYPLLPEGDLDETLRS